MSKKRIWAGVVYALTNLVNGKQYVGKTENDSHEKRWAEHMHLARGDSQFCIHRAIRKYGCEKFSVELIQRCRTKVALTVAEIKWIKRLNTFVPNGYNMTLGGEGTSGHSHTHSAATRKRMSLAQRRRWGIPGVKEARKALLHTPEVQINLSLGQKRRFAKMTKAELEAFGKKLSKAQLKRYAQPGALEVMQRGQAKRFADPAKKAANAAAHRTPAFRKKQSKKSKAKWRDEKWRKRWIRGNNTPEAHAKKSKIGKRWHADPSKQANFLAGCQSEACSQKHSKSLKRWYKQPGNREAHLKAHRTEAFRDRKSKDAKKQWKMTPEQRKAYWHSIHPNGNGYGKAAKK